MLSIIWIKPLMNNTINDSSPLIVWTRFHPTSTDPMKYDLTVHHITMRSVLASLVSTYKSGEIAPQIAKKWSKNEDATEWVVEIDDNWTFENGEKVSTETIKKSLQRVLLLKNRTKSKSGLLEFLLGASELKSIDDNIEGISITKGSIKFKFIKPMAQFLEKISFGIYGIVHPDDYNQKTGEWIDPKKIIASGHYQIFEWSNDIFKLRFRDDLVNKLSKGKRINIIHFNFSKDVDQIHKSDLIIKERINPSIDKNKWRFASTVLDNSITYVKVMKWNNVKSIFSSKKVRAKLRNIFYKSLEDEGFTVTTSFFPLSIRGVSNFEYEKNDFYDFFNEPFTSQPYFTSLSGKELGDIYKKGFENFGKKINATIDIVDYPKDERDAESVFDIQFLTTGVVIDYPFDDIKFMFLSEQGIKLPDETGEIMKLLSKENFSVQDVNSLIWDQAIIWPIRHYSTGFWIKNDSNINISELNLTAHPIDFQFIKWK